MTRLEASPAFAENVVQDLYGLRVQAERLPGEYDDNFRLTDAHGARYVLKIMHPQRDAALIEMQIQALRHLAQRAPDLLTSKIQPCRDGSTYGRARDAGGRERIVWMLDYIEGAPYAETAPQLSRLRESLGEYIGRLDAALEGFEHPAAHRELKWDSARAEWILPRIGEIRDAGNRALVERFMRLYSDVVAPAQTWLRHGVIHGDANECNTLTRARRNAFPEVIAVIDFGDMHYGITLSGLAISAAYAIFGAEDPLEAAADIIAGYHRRAPIPQAELPLILPLIAARLCVSVVNSAIRSALLPDDPYMTISEAPAWQALHALARSTPACAHARFKMACGLPPVSHTQRVSQWLQEHRAMLHPLLDADMTRTIALDWSVASPWLGADPAALRPGALARSVQRELANQETQIAVTRWNEVRLDGDDADGGTAHAQWGMDVIAPLGTTVRAPLAGVMQSAHTAPGEGMTLILRHELEPGVLAYTVIAHLDATQPAPATGTLVASGAPLGRVGAQGSAKLPLAHLRVGLLADLLGMDLPPQQVPASQAALWHAIALDPSALLQLPQAARPSAPNSAADALRRRRSLLGSNLSLSYRRPLKIVRGWRQHLYDESGRAYLDVFNNVPLVGHSHPRVVAAASRQLSLLNTNTRYLHDNVLEYAERLTALMPAPLRVCYFLNSASEANELALRIARTVTGRRDCLVLEHAYHGHTNTLIEISPYKFDGPGGPGRAPWVHVAPIPDDYRGEFRRADPDAGAKYAARLRDIIDGGVKPGAFIAETLPSVGGQVVLPPGYLSQAYAHVRAAGGLCIADEVQVGFGRLGEHFWGFSSQGVVPDMVVLGKPIGNAFPLAALVTTASIAAAFDNGMEFFSTFGGNPVACAVGVAVLDVLRDERLPQNAQQVGRHLIGRLMRVQDRHVLVGDVRGLGLFLGVELVRDRHTLEPAEDESSYVVNRLREEGILAGTDGPHHNVIKIRPPLCIDAADADRFADTLDRILNEDGLRA